jgi:hypothetical protein
MKLIPSYNTISGCVDSISIDNDPKHLNFVGGRTGFGTPLAAFYTDSVVKTESGINVTYELYLDKLTLKVVRRMSGDNYRETYTFINNDDKVPVKVQTDKIGIYVPFNDSVDIPSVTLNRRCHAHIWCGGNCAYIYGLRKNGEENNVGLVLTKGYIDSYGVERKNNLKDRGDFIFYLPEINIEPKQNYEIEWELFAFKDIRDFFDKANEYDPFINLQSKIFSIGLGGNITLTCDRFIDSASFGDEEIHAANTKIGAKVVLSGAIIGEKELV